MINCLILPCRHKGKVDIMFLCLCCSRRNIIWESSFLIRDIFFSSRQKIFALKEIFCEAMFSCDVLPYRNYDQIFMYLISNRTTDVLVQTYFICFHSISIHFIPTFMTINFQISIQTLNYIQTRHILEDKRVVGTFSYDCSHL